MGLVSSTQIESTLERLLSQQAELVSKLKDLSEKNTELSREVKLLKEKIESCIKKKDHGDKRIRELEKENNEMRTRLKRIDALA